MFEAETRAEILKRLVSYFDDSKGTDVSAVEGTFSFDTLSANAKEFEKAYAEMDLMMDAFSRRLHGENISITLPMNWRGCQEEPQHRPK